MLGHREGLQVDRRHGFTFFIGDESVAAEACGMPPAAGNR